MRFNYFINSYLKQLMQKAINTKTYIATAFSANKNDKNYNFGVLISPDGIICGYQPMISSNGNQQNKSGLFIKPIQTKIGKIGLVIDKDKESKEIFQSLIKQGAEKIIRLKLGESLKLI